MHGDIWPSVHCDLRRDFKTCMKNQLLRPILTNLNINRHYSHQRSPPILLIIFLLQMKLNIYLFVWHTDNGMCEQGKYNYNYF